MHRVKVRVVEDALDANNTIARANREDFDRAGVTVVNLMSAPGAGKTTLLERVLRDGVGDLRVGVLEGDVQGSARRRPARAPARARRRSSTPTAASAASATSTRTWCARRCRRCRSTTIDLLIVENVGNLVCPAEFRIGEDARIMVSSVAEGDDKPLQVPARCSAPASSSSSTRSTCSSTSTSSMDRFDSSPRRRCTPASSAMRVSARTGEGVDALRDWLARLARPRGGAGVMPARRRRSTSASPCGETLLRAPRPSGSRGCATRWPSASRAAGG